MRFINPKDDGSYNKRGSYIKQNKTGILKREDEVPQSKSQRQILMNVMQDVKVDHPEQN